MIRVTLEERKVSIKLKNKKGFTLVELLAVIAILAILVVIALPNVMGMFNSAKAGSFQTEVQTMMSQVSSDYVNNTLQSNSKATIFTNLTLVDTVKTVNSVTYVTDDLSLEGGDGKSYMIRVSKSGKIEAVKVWDNSFCIYAEGDDLQKTDMGKEVAYDGSSDTSKKTREIYESGSEVASWTPCATSVKADK